MLLLASALIGGSRGLLGGRRWGAEAFDQTLECPFHSQCHRMVAGNLAFELTRRQRRIALRPVNGFDTKLGASGPGRVGPSPDAHHTGSKRPLPRRSSGPGQEPRALYVAVAKPDGADWNRVCPQGLD